MTDLKLHDDTRCPNRLLGRFDEIPQHTRRAIDQLLSPVDPTNIESTSISTRGANSRGFLEGIRWRDHRER